MCLYIDKEKHPDGKPLIAGYDMLVWKWLFEGDISIVYTHRWLMGRPVSAALDVQEDGVWAGLHAQRHAGAKPKLACDYELPAIIPRGAHFFIGHNGDIVATRLTVYRTLKDALQGRTLGQADFSAHKAAK